MSAGVKAMIKGKWWFEMAVRSKEQFQWTTPKKAMLIAKWSQLPGVDINEGFLSNASVIQFEHYGLAAQKV